ncbi:uncharacterized protein [Aphelocoma coerulescens]|uniref:uncharacterized protein n=1 Tax=Aphelocoma coerulescens TaxID=39617 RepID=UPI0036046B34
MPHFSAAVPPLLRPPTETPPPWVAGIVPSEPPQSPGDCPFCCHAKPCPWLPGLRPPARTAGTGQRTAPAPSSGVSRGAAGRCVPPSGLRVPGSGCRSPALSSAEPAPGGGSGAAAGAGGGARQARTLAPLSPRCRRGGSAGMRAPGAAAACGDGRDEAGRCLSPAGRLAAAVCLGAVGSLGFCSNLLVLLLFWRFRALRSPINLLLLNIALSDLLGCALGTPLGLSAGAAAAPGAACAWHGFATALCGIISLISLAVLSYERYCTMTRTTEADTTNYRKTWTGIILSWTYSLLWTVPPLFGWSSYGPEGPGITCSVNWHSKDANNASYIVCLFIFCLVIPFAIIVYSYGKLLCAVRQNSSAVTCAASPGNCLSCDCPGDRLQTTRALQVTLRFVQLEVPMTASQMREVSYLPYEGLCRAQAEAKAAAFLGKQEHDAVVHWQPAGFPFSELREGLFLPSAAAAAVGSGGSDTYVNTKHVALWVQGISSLLGDHSWQDSGKPWFWEHWEQLCSVQAVLMPYLCLCPTQVSSINKGLGRSREQRILVMVVVMVVCFLLCWLPYAAVALIATFGKPGLITPAASIIPAILAKSSTVYNPIIYVFLNKQFYRCFVALLRCNKSTESSTKALPRPCRALQWGQGGVGPAGTSLAGQPLAGQPLAKSPCPAPGDTVAAAGAVPKARCGT